MELGERLKTKPKITVLPFASTLAQQPPAGLPGHFLAINLSPSGAVALAQPKPQLGPAGLEVGLGNGSAEPAGARAPGCPVPPGLGTAVYHVYSCEAKEQKYHVRGSY